MLPKIDKIVRCGIMRDGGTYILHYLDDSEQEQAIRLPINNFLEKVKSYKDPRLNKMTKSGQLVTADYDMTWEDVGILINGKIFGCNQFDSFCKIVKSHTA